MTDTWVRTNEAEDVACSLRHALRAGQFVSDDPQAWKWVMLALHAALQGACVCHLTTTAAPVGAVTKQNAGEWLAHFDDRRSNPDAVAPKTYLMGFYDLLKAIRKPRSAGDRSNTFGIALSDSELRWLRRFHEDVRNQFTHFEPRSWSIEISGVPAIAALTARIVGDILEVGHAFRHLTAAARAEMQADLQRLRDWPL